MRSKRFFASLLILALAATAAWGCAQARKPLFPAARPGVHAFYVNQPGPTDSFPSLKLHANVLNEVSPLWYHVKKDGSLIEEPVPAAISFARQQGIRIVPLINLVGSQDAVLVDPAVRDRTIANIVNVVKANNYDGVNIDFEFIPEGNKDFSLDRDQLTLFMKLLSGKLHAMGKKTDMSVLPHVQVSASMSGIYDYGGLAPYVDKVTLMCYDHSQGSSPPGPVAPFAWVETNIKTAIEQGFRPWQICLGVATYGYDWPANQTGGFSLPTKSIDEQVSMKGIPVHWSNQYQEPYYSYRDSYGVEREVWFENAATLQTKIDLVKKYKLKGICIWRLGFEDAKFWDTIIKNWGKR
ncbi:glycosyl hydrolase family 18 protein [Desulfotomaculum copahuensis]|nr:glycosyl hydrolase family 18 protein [Desulfotomaculum copahuensis]